MDNIQEAKSILDTESDDDMRSMAKEQLDEASAELPALEENIKLNNCDIKPVLGDVIEQNIIDSLPFADVITCNPPYLTKDDMENLQKEVSFEPAQALYGGDDGLDFYRQIIRLYKNKFNENGMLVFEIGIGQEDEVMAMMIQHGFKDVRVRADLCGVNRCVFGFYRQNQKLCTDVMSV